MNHAIQSIAERRSHGAPATRRPLRSSLLAVALLGGSSAHAQSTSDQLLDLVRRQAAQIEALDARVKALEAQLSAGGSAAGVVPATAASSSTSAPAVKPQSGGSSGTDNTPVIKWKGGPEISSSDGRFMAKLRGRVLSDVWATSSEVSNVDYPSGTEIRAARLGIEGRLNPIVTYKMEADFANEQTVLKDAWLQFKGSGPTAFTIGNFKPLFSLEHLTGLPRVTFLERALPNVFAIVESIGFQVETYGTNWYSGISAFGEPPGTALEGDEGYGLAARLAFAPVLEKDRFVHLGLAGYHKFLGADAGRDFRIRQRPEVRVFATRLADTGRGNADSTQALGLEFATAFGPFSVQGEYMQNRVDYTTGEATFDGGYLFGSWLVTGESRPYSISNSTIGRVKPTHAFGDGGWGALELALRFSTLDLGDSGVFGGEEDNMTLGVNWYFTDYARLMVNWVHYDLDDNTSVRPFGSADHEGEALGVRAQVDW